MASQANKQASVNAHAEKQKNNNHDEKTKGHVSNKDILGFSEKEYTPAQRELLKKIQKEAKKNSYNERVKQEEKVEENPFAISLYNPNYALPFYYTAKPAYTIYGNTTPEQQKLQHHEFKAQFSFKVPVWARILRSKFSLYLAYTQKFYWQVYTRSAYFRESNYEPEVFVEYPLFDWNTWRVGVVHQSNGRGGDMERSWNRVYVEGIFSLRHWMLSLKPWVLVANKSTRVYNRDIARYLGHGRLVIAYKYRDFVFSLMGRNNLESGFRRGAIEAAVSFPVFKRLHGYIQYFDGYGQSLIEYNHRTSAVGVGLILNNWI